MGNAWKHLKTINNHRRLVRKGCFKIGLYYQGLTHDLSKYSPAEFIPSVKYYQGDRSPHDAQRKAEGCAPGWLHHKGRNKHHFEYWIDYAVGETDQDKIKLAGMKMPVKYVAEMFVDRWAACKNYNKDKNTDRSALEYYLKGRDHMVIHPETEALLVDMLTKLAEEGEEAAFAYIKHDILHK